jgi:hypothetical protein
MNPQPTAGVAQEDQDAAKLDAAKLDAAKLDAAELDAAELDAAERGEDITLFGRHEGAEGAQPSCSASVS